MMNEEIEPPAAAPVAAPVVFFNRYTQRVETEKIYGERSLRWVYETPLGRLALAALVRRAVFSRWFGWRSRTPASRAKIAPFIQEFGLDAAEFAQPPDEFASFDDFFSRKLKPAARPLAGTDAVFPADGRHLGFQDISKINAVYAKGQRFELAEFLGNAALAERYRDGALVCSRLCPTDYHRFHFPAAGTPAAPALVNGWLYSVNPIALRRNLAALWENKRAVISLDAGALGTVLLVIVGATNVGSFTFTHRAGAPVAKGDECGFFSFGGSFVATLFERGKICLADDLLRETAAGRELYVKMGDALGTAGSVKRAAPCGSPIAVGTDLVEVARIRQLCERHGDAFLERVFTPAERAYCQNLANPWQSLAARWAAKESVAKALGTGFNGELDWKSIGVVNDANGAPHIVLDAKATALLTARGGTAIRLSLTHTADLAQATVVVV